MLVSLTRVEDIRVTYAWTKEELIKAQRSNQRAGLRPAILRVVDVLVYSLAAISIVIICIDGLRKTLPLWSFVLFAAFWLALKLGLSDWWVAQGFRKLPGAEIVLEFYITEKQVRQEFAGVSSSTFDWVLINKVVEGVDGFQLFLNSKKQFFWLPFKGFQRPEDIELFKEIAKRKGMPYLKSK